MGSYIAGTNGTSNGLVPMLRVYNNTARYVDQGGNKRPGAFAMYLEPWHADVFEFLDLRKNTGKSGMQSLNLRLKPVRHTCSTRMLVTAKVTSKILEPSNAPTSAQKLLNILPQMRLPFVILHQLLSTCM